MSVSVHIVDGPVRPEPAIDPGTEPGGTSGAGRVREPSEDAAAGAVLTFLGVVRGLEDDRPIVAIDYQTYDPMAQRELERLANESVKAFGLLALRLVHSRGVVPVARPSLLIEIRSAHRREGLDAMDHLIDQLKRDVPIWKRPIFADATAELPHERSGHA